MTVYDPTYPDSVQVMCLLTGTSSYYDLSADVVSTIHGEYGLSDTGYTDLVAVPGLLTFNLKNLNSDYLFGLGGTLSGWQKGIKIVVIINYFGKPIYVYTGYLDDTEPDEPIWGLPTVKVSIVDWMEKASDFKLRKVQQLTSKRINDGVDAVVDMMPFPPSATSYDTGLDTFPTIFDGTKVNDTAITEFQRLAMSEFAPIYLRMVKVGGGEQLRVEGRGTRTSSLNYANVPNNYIFLGNEWGGLICADQGLSPLLIDTVSSVGALEPIKADIESGKNTLNELSCRVYPRRVDVSTQTLFTLQRPILLVAGETKTNILGQYTDPNGGGTKVNADPATMLTLVTGTDIRMNASSDGSGLDKTAALVLNYTFGSEGITFNSLTNTGTASAWITRLNARGKGTYFYEPIDYTNTNTGSVQNLGTYYLQLDQKYQDQIDTGKGIVDILLDRESNDTRTRIRKMYFNANTCPDNMFAFLYLDIGDLVPLTFMGQNLSLSSDYVINRKEFDIEMGGIINYAFEYVEFLPLVSAPWLVETVGRGELGVNTYVGV